ncbi:Site-specific recombinase XerD [Sphingobium sp. AP50]|uniref:tyrosine-type recombinase/integrase n=1 Tax=Sphingobium sp. AP50 TaxID=1884369 RepID=UPI0008CEA13D|nr:tyrosine-type recombinase/integrase [Sphingobium sp. AP50]SEJ65662.1 Site-specific recombinase XerD [Sphingobium sp. AP50]
MSRAVADVRLQDRTVRVRLSVKSVPYWRLISEGFHLGYYKGARKASWVVRLRRTDKPNAYVTAALGEADDILDANDTNILTWKQAFAKALQWMEVQTKGLPSALDPNITVATAIAAYIERRDARKAAQAGRAVRSDAHYKLQRHVLSDKRLSGLALRDITEADLRAWQKRLSKQKYTSTQRLLNEVKAALNAAWAEHRQALPADLPITIKYGLALDAPAVLESKSRENQILADAEIRKIVAAALEVDQDFGRMVAVLAATGARFAQLRRMTVGDALLECGRLMIPQSFKGKKKDNQHIRVAVGPDIVDLLRPAVADRSYNEPLLERWHVRQITAVRWERYERGAWKTSSELSRHWQDAMKKAGLPAATIPYALRHSSIVRGLRLGLPIRLVAALHDTSVVMIERHYSRWIVDGLDDLAVRAVVPLLSGPV